jgi:MYXO-CTERM domain-containing protein
VTLPALAPFATASATLPIRLDEGVTTPTSIDLSVALSDPSAAAAPAPYQISTPANLDVAPATSASDDFEAPTLAWTASASGWTRAVAPDSNGHDAHVAVAIHGDHTLTTPALVVAAGQHLTVAFSHRHHFDRDANGAPVDGGVLELSSNGGTTWVDVATLTTPAGAGYGPTLATGTGNPLAGRAAWGGNNPGFPAFAAVALDLGAGFGGQTVKLRFRAGGDGVAGSSGWDVDQVAIGGLTNLPFPSLVPNATSCLPGQRPVAQAADVTVASGAAGVLDGSTSFDPDGTALTYEWTQLSGVALGLSSPTAAAPTFTAPTTLHTRVARFELLVRDATNRVSLPVDLRVTILGTALPDAGVDAATPDAAPPADATPIPVDAPASPDAAIVTPDAGTPLVGGGGGCGCRSGGDARGGLALAFGLAVLLTRPRRRRG